MGYNVVLASSIASEGYTYIVRLLYSSNEVAQTVFDLSPETSPFWTGFWNGIRGGLFGILVTSTIIIVTSALTGGRKELIRT